MRLTYTQIKGNWWQAVAVDCPPGVKGAFFGPLNNVRLRYQKWEKGVTEAHYRKLACQPPTLRIVV